MVIINHADAHVYSEYTRRYAIIVQAHEAQLKSWIAGWTQKVNAAVAAGDKVQVVELRHEFNAEMHGDAFRCSREEMRKRDAIKALADEFYPSKATR